MDYAKQRGAEKLVRAYDAFPGRYYTCPSCSGEVFLRRGRWRVPHFAHWPGQGKADCDLFHPSDDLTYSWPSYGKWSGQGQSVRPIDPLLLSIELEPESISRGKRRRGWGLRLTVPKSEDSHGQITIDCGGGSKRTIGMVKLSLAAQTYPVDLNAQDFGSLWTSPEVRPEYKAVIDDRVLGLDRELITVFGSTTQRYKPHAERLTWGNSYYFVWNVTADLSLPRKLISQPLATEGDWDCAFVTLPDEDDADLKTWLEEVTAVSVVSYRRVFGLVYPPPCGLDIQGRIIFPASGRLIVGLRQPDAEPGGSIELRATSAEASSQVSLEGTGRHLAEIAVDSNRNKISLKLNETSLPLLVPTVAFDADIFPKVSFSFRDVATPGFKTVSLTEREGLRLLAETRRGQHEISGCTLPVGVKATLRWKAWNDTVWTALSLESSSVPSSDKLTRLNEIVRNRLLEIEIDCGPFGIFRALPEKKRSSAVRPIPARLRHKMLWLCSTSSVFTNERGVPLRSLPDHEIAPFILATRLRPELTAQKRSLVRELARLQVREATS